MKTMRKMMSLLIAALLVMSLATTAFAADEYEEMDVYTLHHNVADDGYDGPNLQYFSPYVTDFAFDGQSSFIQSNIYSMYNTLNGEVIPVYCTDILVGAYADHRYRQLNLEDSTFAASASGKLRAIMRNGFYLENISGETTDAHAVRVEEELARLGAASGVEGLTIGEAISGTQLAIWQAAHGSRLRYTDFFRTLYTTKMPSATKYYDLCNEERENGHVDYTVSTYGKVTVTEESDAYIASRIKAVYDYLLSLQPIAASQRVVSPASFIQTEESAPSLNADGTYDITVSATVDVQMAAGDYLTLSAVVDPTHFSSADLHDGVQTVNLTVRNVPAELVSEPVMLNIDGMQTADEVFIYDAYGDRETAQTMIGIDGSQQPVHTVMRATQNRILNFYKTARINVGNDNYERRPLEGITFDIFFVANLNDYLTGAVTLPPAEEYDYPDMADHVVITDAEGKASVNFTQHGLEDGVYLVVERDHPAIKAPVAPFYVTMPSTNPDGTGQVYEVTVQPKNEVKGNVHIEKDVTSIGNDKTDVDAYAKHTWIIGTNIPEDIASGKSYVITDTLDNRLDYIGNLKVVVESLDGTTVLATLTEGVDYELTVNDRDSLSDGKPSDSFKVELTRAGMLAVADALGENSYEDYMIRVYFDAQINANAGAGEEIPNDAILNYVNSVGFDFEVESDKPVVVTGGANLLKVDSTDHDRVLPGAVFEVYRKATAEEVANGDSRLTHIDGVGAAVIKVSFFDSPQMRGDKVTSVTSDDEGKAAIYGLACGSYYLVETQSPGGYNLLAGPVELIIDESSHMEERTVTVENVAGSELPATGGMGTTVFTVGGLLLISLSAVLLVLKKRETTAA